jgi:uncharacterized protein (DUF1697 family)
MPRYFAFLRAINVGGRYVKMEQLRGAFEALGLTNVETFIASGNVTFEAPAGRTDALTREIEAAVSAAIGYESAVFLRSAAQVKSIAQQEPFGRAARNSKSGSVQVALLCSAPNAAVRKAVLALSAEQDELRFHGQELYWQAHGGVGRSRLTTARLERALDAPTTLRNVNTFARLVAKYLH